MKLPAFYPIVDTAACARTGRDPLAQAIRLVEAGARILQFRHKGPFVPSLYGLAGDIAEVCHAAGVAYIVNDRSDVALSIGADGVHLGQEDLPPRPLRQVLPDAFRIGFSTHNETQFKDGLAQPVDYLALGPVFATASKQRPDPVVGVEECRRLRRECTLPLVAIGGITLANVEEVLEAGADSVAVISGWMEGDLAPWLALKARG